MNLPIPLFDKAFENATDLNDWHDMVILANNDLLFRMDFADILSWLPRADPDTQRILLAYIAHYFIKADNLTERDLALIQRFPQLAQRIRHERLDIR